MILRDLGLVDYAASYAAMRAFTEARTPETPDELWLCEHPSVFTLGQAGRAEHVLNPGDIPVIASNRGGQVTYHGPGQIVAYPLVDLRRAGYFVKEYVHRLEEAVIRTLATLGVTGQRVAGAPGIYVALDDPFAHTARHGPPHGADAFAGLAKISALGIKIQRHCSYHGVALNVAMDLEPFQRINPCGYPGLRTVDLATIGVHVPLAQVRAILGDALCALLSPRAAPTEATPS